MKAAKIIACVFVTLAILAALSVVGYFVYTFVRNGQKSFYLSYGDARIGAGTNEIELQVNTTAFFTGRTIAGVGNENTQIENYTVSVVPTKKLASTVRYRAGDDNEIYIAADTDFSKTFKLAKYGATFSVFVPSDVDLKAALSAALGKDVDEISDVPSAKDAYFYIKVVYEAENATILIPLRLTLNRTV